MKMVAQESCKLHKPSINKLEDGYSAMANLVFQSWLKDIKVCGEDQNLTEKEAIQVAKDFTAECAHIEVEFYMGMVVEDQKTFNGLVSHLKMPFSWVRP